MSSNFPTAKDDLLGTQPVVDGASGTIFEASWLNTLQDAVDQLQEKVGIDSSADNASIDYKLARKGVFFSGATVFNTHCTASDTWQDLDLSSQVGANAALVLLEVYGAAAMYVGVKPKGYGQATVVAHTSSGGLGAAASYLGGKTCYLVGATNASGVLQIGATVGGNAAYAMTIKLIAFSR